MFHHETCIGSAPNGKSKLQSPPQRKVTTWTIQPQKWALQMFLKYDSVALNRIFKINMLHDMNWYKELECNGPNHTLGRPVTCFGFTRRIFFNLSYFLTRAMHDPMIHPATTAPMSMTVVSETFETGALVSSSGITVTLIRSTVDQTASTVSLNHIRK